MGGESGSGGMQARCDEKQIDALFAELDGCHLPGAAVGISIAGRPVYRKGFGLASLELPMVLSPTIRMRIASITKHFTCLAYLLLCEAGRAGVDDEIGWHLPDIHPVGRRVTIRQLMGHVSGLRDVSDIGWQLSGTGRAASSADLIAFYRDIDDVNCAPGTAWNYNNGGYLLLGAAIERISGRPLEDVLRETIFAPVGMNDTLLRRLDTDFVPNSATLHMARAEGGYHRHYLGALAGEGGIVSTVDDMLRWLAHMDAPVIGTSATWELMKEPLTLVNGTSTGYGLGLITSEYRGVQTLSHSGGLMGGNSFMAKVPSARLDVVILVNRHDVAGVLFVNKILDACIPHLTPIREAGHEPVSEGIYHSLSTGRVIQLSGRDGQQIASIDGVDMPVEADRGGLLRPVPWLSFLKQSVTRIGDVRRPSALRFDHFGNVDELNPVVPSDGDVAQIAGTYRSQPTGTTLTISGESESPRLHSTGRFGSAAYRLECLGEGLWRARSEDPMAWGGILAFDAAGIELRFTTVRNWNLIFRRVP
jgi:CubicO group peptidase (beta-lactamase class C family)